MSLGQLGAVVHAKQKELCRKLLAITLISSFAIHLLRFYVIMFLEADAFREILDWLILVVYTVVTFAFLPLFVTIMTLLEVNMPEIYQRIKC